MDPIHRHKGEDTDIGVSIEVTNVIDRKRKTYRTRADPWGHARNIN